MLEWFKQEVSEILNQQGKFGGVDVVEEFGNN
jgi:hypothetical protein